MTVKRTQSPKAAPASCLVIKPQLFIKQKTL